MTAAVDPWYIEQEARIKEATSESARLRLEMRRKFDPGHLYVVLFDSGVIKVGKAGAVDARLAAHAKTGFVRQTWTSQRHLSCSATERDLIAFCNAFGTLYGGREYFTGIEFRHAIAYAGLVVRNSLRRAYLEALIEAADGDLSVTWQTAHVRAYGEDVAA